MERVDVQTAWGNALDLGTVQTGKGSSATGNLLAVFNELRKLSEEWVQKLDIGCTRTHNKYMQMKKMVDYFGQYQKPKAARAKSPTKCQLNTQSQGTM